MQDIHGQRVLVIDFGSQYTQLIARRVREAGVYCEIHPFDAPADFIRSFAPAGVILSGGPETVTAGETPRVSDAVFDVAVPILGICYGMQAMAAHFSALHNAPSIRDRLVPYLQAWLVPAAGSGR